MRAGLGNFLMGGKYARLIRFGGVKNRFYGATLFFPLAVRGHQRRGRWLRSSSPLRGPPEGGPLPAPVELVPGAGPLGHTPRAESPRVADHKSSIGGTDSAKSVGDDERGEGSNGGASPTRVRLQSSPEEHAYYYSQPMLASTRAQRIKCRAGGCGFDGANQLPASWSLILSRELQHGASYWAASPSLPSRDDEW